MLTHEVNIGLAFLAGLASFLAPCVLPLVPAYLSYLSGYTLGQPDEQVRGTRTRGTRSGGARWHVVLHAVAFVLGFSLIFVLLGSAVGALGRLVRGDWLRYLGSLVMILFGLTLMGLLHIPLFEQQARVTVKRRVDWGYASSLLAGIAFGAGWTPCVGPALSSILVLSADQGTVAQGVILLIAYSAGIGVPFILAAFVIERLRGLIMRIGPYQATIQKVVGAIILLVGILLFTDNLATIGQWMENAGLGWDLGL